MSPKLGFAIAILLAAAGLSVVVVGGIEDNLVYYWTPTELLDKGEQGVGANVRLGGMVKSGSVDWNPESLDLRFEVHDGAETIRVHSQGVPPEMFRENVGIVVEGTLSPGGVFECDRLLVKHGNEYTAPDDGEHPDMQDLAKSLEDDSS